MVIWGRIIRGACIKGKAVWAIYQYSLEKSAHAEISNTAIHPKGISFYKISAADVWSLAPSLHFKQTREVMAHVQIIMQFIIKMKLILVCILSFFLSFFLSFHKYIEWHYLFWSFLPKEKGICILDFVNCHCWRDRDVNQCK